MQLVPDSMLVTSLSLQPGSLVGPHQLVILSKTPKIVSSNQWEEYCRRCGYEQGETFSDSPAPQNLLLPEAID